MVMFHGFFVCLPQGLIFCGNKPPKKTAMTSYPDAIPGSRLVYPLQVSSWNRGLPSGYLTKSYWKWPSRNSEYSEFSHENSMVVIFHSYVTNYQRVIVPILENTFKCSYSPYNPHRIPLLSAHFIPSPLYNLRLLPSVRNPKISAPSKRHRSRRPVERASEFVCAPRAKFKIFWGF